MSADVVQWPKHPRVRVSDVQRALSALPLSELVLLGMDLEAYASGEHRPLAVALAAFARGEIGI